VQGSVYRVTVRRVHVESVEVKYPEALRLESRTTTQQVEHSFRYLDRIDAVESGRVSLVTRHFLEARRRTGEEKEETLWLEGRRLTLECAGRGRVTFKGADGDELAPELTLLAVDSVVPEEPMELGPPRTRTESLVKVLVAPDWPGQDYRSWPRVFTRAIEYGWAPTIRQGNWKTRFEGKLSPLGNATLTMRIFGDKDDEDDGIPVVHVRGRELTVELEVTKADDDELPLSYEAVLAEIRELIATEQLDQARERYRAVEEGMAHKMPGHLREELRQIEALLR
jgi:hypothetical protein